MWRRLGLILIGVWSASAPVVMAQTISGISLTLGASETTIVIEGEGSKAGTSLPTPKIFMIEGKQPRIVADFKTANASLTGRKGAGGQTFLEGAGHVTGIRFAPRGEAGLRLVFDLTSEAELHKSSTAVAVNKTGNIIFTAKGKSLSPNKIVTKPVAVKTLANVRRQKCKSVPCPRLAPHINAHSSKTNIPVAKMAIAEPISVTVPKRVLKPRYFGSKIPFPRLKSFPTLKVAKPYRRPVIVIDPGHGGRDPGAIGTRKTREKDITFKASLQLQKELLKSGRYEVILTRTDDTYIEHSERLRIARAGGADLFISVHADAFTFFYLLAMSNICVVEERLPLSRLKTSTFDIPMDVE